MLVPITCKCGECPEWAMLELQGEIKVQDTAALSRGLDVGNMCLSSQGTLTLTVGYHQLDGKRMPLKKPLAILTKKKAAGGGTPAKSGGACGAGGTVEYDVVGVLRQKFIFKNRPKALISKPEEKNGVKRLKVAAPPVA